MKKLLILMFLLIGCVSYSFAEEPISPLMTDLEQAISMQDVNKVHELLELGVRVKAVGISYNPLLRAVTSSKKTTKSLDIIKDLVAHGADITATSSVRSFAVIITEISPLHSATVQATHLAISRRGEISGNEIEMQIWKLLLDIAAEQNVLYKEKNLLGLAIRSGYYTSDMVRELLSRGVEVRSKDIKLVKKLLNQSPEVGSLNEVKNLLEQAYKEQHMRTTKKLGEELKKLLLGIPSDPNIWKY